ncbi:MAG: hypothetical protein ACI35O_14530 [Bacillaceae bacterium]
MGAKIIASKLKRHEVLGYQGFMGWRAKDQDGNVCLFMTLDMTEMTKDKVEMKINLLSMPKAKFVMNAIYPNNNYIVKEADKEAILNNPIRLFLRKQKGHRYTEFGVKKVKFVPKQDIAGRFIFDLVQ